MAVDKWFSRRHEWILHDIENHWKSYICPRSCGEAFTSRFKCVEHVQKSHPDSIPAHQLEAVINLSSEPIQIEHGTSCPICHESLDSMKEYQHHVGRHQEQVAIFALPTTQPREDNDGIADEHRHAGKREIGNIKSGYASTYTAKDNTRSESGYTSTYTSMNSTADSGYASSYAGTSRFVGNRLGNDVALFTGDIGGLAAAEMIKHLFESDMFKKDEK